MNITNRGDIIGAFNGARFLMRHYAKGIWPTARPDMNTMAVNRIFIPLENPHGAENFIAEKGAVHELRPGSLYFVPAFLPTRFHLDDRLLFLSLQTNVEIFPGVELFSGCSRMAVIPLPEEARGLLELVDSPPEKLFLDALRAGSLLFRLQIALLGQYGEEDFRAPLTLRRYASLTDFLTEKGNARTSVEELARFRGESREHFTRHFAACTGITPKQFIDRFVISKCLDLLDSGLSVKETAAVMNFSSEFAFSRYFKRNMGESPRAWMARKRPRPPVRDALPRG